MRNREQRRPDQNQKATSDAREGGSQQSVGDACPSCLKACSRSAQILQMYDEELKENRLGPRSVRDLQPAQSPTVPLKWHRGCTLFIR